MQIATGHNLSVTYVTEELFRDVSFAVDSGAHIGLVGKNGSGKTTLFRLITGQLTPTTGQVIFSRECRLAYMEQFLDANEDDSLYQAVLHVFAPLMKIEQELEAVNQRLNSSADAALLAEQSRLQERYADNGGYTYRSRLRAALLGLGFSENELTLPISALSGGQRSKAALAKVLLTDANLILLDEPTNHLDIESIQWLENYLINYRGAFIVMSHDRYFLDKVCGETWDMHHGRMHCYRGNYSQHLLLRDGEEEGIRRRYANQMKEIRRVESIIAQQRRFNQARNYVTIASKEKQLARLKADLVAPEQAERSLSFEFNTPPPGGNDVLELHELSKGFGPRQLFRQVSLQVHKGERVFLLGKNGSGKSTMMKIIMGQHQPDHGLVKLGANIIPAYYDQLHGHISGTQSILEYFTDAYPRLTQTKIRTMLGSFLFSADDVNKTLDMLSGGEKARLELMKLILEPANLLLLDEPSNHLDIDSMEAVENALEDYPGAMLIISHDRYLINKMADRVYYLQPDGLLEVLGNYDDLLERLEQLSSAEQAVADTADSSVADAVGDSGDDYRRRKEERAAERKRQKQLAQLQEQIAHCEQELARIEQEMLDNARDYQLLMQLQEQKDAIEMEYLDYLEQCEQLEQE